MTEVFLSYSRRQQPYARALAGHLRERGVPVWLDDELISGDRWEQVIRDRIDGCAALVVVMTPDAEESAWVRRELARAQDRGKPVFPVLLDGEVFFRLADVQAEDVRGGAMPGDRFVTALLRLVGTAAEERPEAARLPATTSAPRLTRVFTSPERRGPAIGVRFSADGARLLATTAEGRLFEWDVVTGRVLRKMDSGGIARFGGYALGGHLVVHTKSWSTVANRVRCWDAGERLIIDRRFDRNIIYIAWDDEADRCAVVSGGYRVTEWVVRGDTVDWQAEYGSVQGAFYRPGQGLSLFSVSKHNVVAWDARTGAESLVWDQVNASVQFTVSSTSFVAAGDREVRIWSHTGELEDRWALPAHRKWAWVALDPLRRWLAVPGGTKEVHLIARATGEVEHVLRHDARVYVLNFAPDGAALAVGDDKGRVHVWRL